MAINIPQPQEESTEVKIWTRVFRTFVASITIWAGYAAHGNYVDYLTVEAGIAKGFSPAEARCALNGSLNNSASTCVIFASKK